MAILFLTLIQVRCHQYWPGGVGGTAEFGDVSVTLVEYETYAEYARREMVLRMKVYAIFVSLIDSANSLLKVK